jgi:4-diphosphocytidyl-2-C-methyl-D-erythritol kinase
MLEPAADDTVHLDGCGNDLEAPVARRHPEIAAIVARVRSAGARLAAMSGSGSACFGIFAPDADVSGLDAAWRDGTIVLRTRLLSRAAHARATACRRLA